MSGRRGNFLAWIRLWRLVVEASPEPCHQLFNANQGVPTWLLVPSGKVSFDCPWCQSPWKYRRNSKWAGRPRAAFTRAPKDADKVRVRIQAVAALALVGMGDDPESLGRKVERLVQRAQSHAAFD